MNLDLDSLLEPEDEGNQRVAMPNVPPPDGMPPPPPKTQLPPPALPTALPRPNLSGALLEDLAGQDEPDYTHVGIPRTRRTPGLVWVLCNFFATVNKYLAYLMFVAGIFAYLGIALVLDYLEQAASQSTDVQFSALSQTALLIGIFLPAILTLILSKVYKKAAEDSSKILAFILSLVTLPLNMLFAFSILFDPTANADSAPPLWYFFIGVCYAGSAFAKMYIMLRVIIPSGRKNRFAHKT